MFKFNINKITNLLTYQIKRCRIKKNSKIFNNYDTVKEYCDEKI